LTEKHQSKALQKLRRFGVGETLTTGVRAHAGNLATGELPGGLRLQPATGRNAGRRGSQLLDLRPEKVSPMEMAKFWLAQHPENLGDFSLRRTIEELLCHKRKLNLRKEYNDARRWALGRFARDFPGARLKDLTTEKVDHWLDAQKFSAKNKCILDEHLLMRVQIFCHLGRDLWLNALGCP
jgi:hypothetical protein